MQFEFYQHFASILFCFVSFTPIFSPKIPSTKHNFLNAKKAATFLRIHSPVLLPWLPSHWAPLATMGRIWLPSKTTSEHTVNSGLLDRAAGQLIENLIDIQICKYKSK